MLNKVVNFSLIEFTNIFSLSRVFSLNSTLLSCIITLLQNNFFSYKITKWHFWVIDKENSYWHSIFYYYLVYKYFFTKKIKLFLNLFIIVLSLILFRTYFRSPCYNNRHFGNSVWCRRGTYYFCYLEQLPNLDAKLIIEMIKGCIWCLTWKSNLGI